MAEKTKIGILLCDYHCGRCHGIKCFRALNNREGAFSDYKDKDFELVHVAAVPVHTLVTGFLMIARKMASKSFSYLQVLLADTPRVPI